MSGLFSNLLRKNSMDGKSDAAPNPKARIKQQQQQQQQQVVVTGEAAHANKMAEQQARIKSEREGARFVTSLKRISYN